MAFRDRRWPDRDNRGISWTRKITRFVPRHPLLSILAAVLVFAGAGALFDTLTGPSGEGAPLCGDGGPAVSAPAGQQQRDARRDYESLWTGAAPLLGSSGKPPPRLRFVGAAAARPGPRAPMWMGPDANNCRTIFIAPGARRLLARSYRSRFDRSHHRAAERWAIHETAHYFQSDEVLRNTSLREYGATQWEKAHSPVLIGTRKKATTPRFNRFRDREQFGPNYGGNPLTFTFPTQASPGHSAGAARGPS